MLACDDEFLYLAVSCRKAAGAAVLRRRPARDRAIRRWTTTTAWMC